MDKKWQKVARRIVRGLGIRPGELIEVRDAAGCQDALLETSLAIEGAGATPIFQLIPPGYLERLWGEVLPATLARWDRFRGEWLKEVDRVLVLAAAHPDFTRAAQPGLEAWRQAQQRLTVIEEERRLPFLLVALPTAEGARQLGLPLETYEGILLPALEASVPELRLEIERVLHNAGAGHTITIHSGNQHILQLEHGDRLWLSDDGLIDETDQEQGAIVSNLPAGSIYTTVIEEATQGSLWLPKAGEAREVVLRFEAGRIVDIQAASGAEALMNELARHSGEPRRVSHIGLGLNPYLDRPVGWTLVDEHIHGHLFIALGENRYMGGRNESSLNVDYALAGATLMVADRMIVLKGKVVS